MNEKQRRPVKVFFDGGCRPNPGPMETAVVMRGVAEIRRGLGDGDSEQAEWLALLNAMEIAARQGERDVILIGDSLPVIRQASGAEPCHSEMTRRLQQRFRDGAGQFERVRLRHVKRTQNFAGIALERARWVSTDA